MPQAPHNIDVNRIPVTIITGFLGSGKTTFLNHLLKKYDTTRFAIIENEFGKLGVDGKLINSEEDTPIYELVNGCICCSLNSDFYQALLHIYEYHNNIDHLLVETTGIADPSKVLDLFVANEQIQKFFSLNSVICLADAGNIESLLAQQSEAVRQVVLSDIVMLNKIDLLQGDQVNHLRGIIEQMNPMADILETSYAHTNGTPVLSTRAYSGNHIEKSTLSFDSVRVSLHPRGDGPMAFDPALQKHEIQAEAFVFNACFVPELFKIWISSFVYFNQHSLYRVKGILYFKDTKKRFVFHAVKGNCVFEEGSVWQNGEEQFSKIVFIGKDINREELSSNLDKFFLQYPMVELKD
jgi:G3E family GTPase